MKCGIYKITNLINGKIYIGQSIHIETRWQEEFNEAFYENRPAYNRPLSVDIREYGWNNFSKEVIEECDEKFLNNREEYWILYYNSLQPNGYNTALISAQKFERITDKLFDKGEEVRNLIKNTNLSLTEIAKQFDVGLSTVEDINQGRTWTDPKETYPLRVSNKRQGVAQFTLGGELVKEYTSIAAAARETGIDNSSITKVCNGKRNQAGGYRWARID